MDDQLRKRLEKLIQFLKNAKNTDNYASFYSDYHEGLADGKNFLTNELENILKWGK